MNEKMKLAIIKEITDDFFECYDSDDECVEYRLGKTESTLDAIFSIINMDDEDKETS